MPSRDSAAGWRTETEYLTRLGVEELISDVLGTLLEHRPRDPIALAAEFFQAAADPVPKVTQAFRFLQLTRNDSG